ncbi:hypothetical protein evm_001814 [Chilo suppressalis]|nr:hypothetical protein evm_001814 [Chilo suppressalis]
MVSYKTKTYPFEDCFRFSVIMSNLEQCHSFYGKDSLKDSLQSEAIWKSDVKISANIGIKSGKRGQYDDSKCCSSYRNCRPVDSYYKKYEHDVVPIKENSKLVNPEFHEIEAGDSSKILTNSELEKLEKKIYNTMSKELQTDDSSISSLQSNIQLKCFKATFLKIFDNFYTSMRDIETYKSRLEEILSKNKVDAVNEMESFIEDVFNHIMSSDSNIRQENRNSVENLTTEIKDKDVTGMLSTTSSTTNRQTVNLLESLHSVVEAYKRDNYQYDCPSEDALLNTSTKKEEILNIYVQGGAPYLHITMNDRNLLSETNKYSNNEKEHRPIASADNLKMLAAKKQQIEYEYNQVESLSIDREIPVKASFAKKNICLDEDFTHVREKDENKSFISKICNYICKKLRRT